jgi:hypothetical protein
MSAFPTWMIEGDEIVIPAAKVAAALAAFKQSSLFSPGWLDEAISPAEQLCQVFVPAYDTETEITATGDVRLWHFFNETLIGDLAEPFRIIAAFVRPGTVEFSIASDGEEGPEDVGEACRFIFDGTPAMKITYREHEGSAWEDWQA